MCIIHNIACTIKKVAEVGWENLHNTSLEKESYDSV